MLFKETLEESYSRNKQKFCDGYNLTGTQMGPAGLVLRHVPNRELIKRCNYNIPLFYWRILEHRNGSQYIVGYLPNRNYWQTSSIHKIRFCYDARNLEHLEAKTNNGTIYKLPLRLSNTDIYDETWVNLDKTHVYDGETVMNVNNGYRVIDVYDWSIENHSWRGGSHRVYYLRGQSPNGYKIFSNKITNIVFGKSLGKVYLYFISKGGFKYRVNILESRYYDEFLHIN